MEKTFLRNNTIWYAFYSKVATLKNFEKFYFSGKKSIFQKKSKFRTYLKSPTISVTFYVKIATIWWLKKIQIQNLVTVRTIGKQTYKNNAPLCLDASPSIL